MTRPVNMPFDQWPMADQKMWRSLLLPGGPLDDRGKLSQLRPVTQKSLCLHYGRWLEWLHRTQPATLALAPAPRATAERLFDWAKSLAHTSTASREMFINATVRILKVAAPDQDWSRQMQLGRSLRRAASLSTSDRKNGRVLDSAVLLRAGLELAGPASQGPPHSVSEVKRFRDGIMLAFLSLLPMRRRSFGHLQLGRSVMVIGSDIHIVLTGDMTKNGHPWETRVPPILSARLRHYITMVRPWLLHRGGAAHDFLWVSDRGKPYALDYLGTRIADITERQLGIRIYPHLFRDAAATSLSRRSPENARLIRPILAQSSHGTAEKHYIQAGTIEAGRDYSAMLNDLLGEDEDRRLHRG